MDKATPTTPPAPASYDSVMALYKEVMEALLFDSDSVADAETEFLAEVERLAAQAAPTADREANLRVADLLLKLDREGAKRWAEGILLAESDGVFRVDVLDQPSQAPVVQAGEYPPRPFDNHFDQAFRPATTAQAVRMLTPEEVADCAVGGFNTVAALKAERDAALARVAELEKDAARYRWLRLYSIGIRPWGHSQRVASGLDKEIDAALTKEQP